MSLTFHKLSPEVRLSAVILPLLFLMMLGEGKFSSWRGESAAEWQQSLGDFITESWNVLAWKGP